MNQYNTRSDYNNIACIVDETVYITDKTIQIMDNLIPRSHAEAWLKTT
jgi:hypothetical protein